MNSAGGSDPLLGRHLAGRYLIEILIARGGMARVYRARDDRLDRSVAVKILSQPYTDDPAFVDRFLGEARTAASLSHPNLVHVYDSGSDEGLHYIVMEFLERYRSLKDEIVERGRLPAARVARIGSEILAGLSEVHRRGLVHCDVKTGNVMTGPGPAKLIDFGIARTPRMTEGGELSIGSLHYMAPEQISGSTLSAASDLYAVGVVLYEALTGRVPYEGATAAEVAAAQRTGRPVPPSTLVPGVPAALEGVVLQAISPRPGRRFESATAMLRALSAAGRVADETTESQTAVRPVAERPVAARSVPSGGAARQPPRGRARRASGRPWGRRLLAALGPALLIGAAAAVIVLAAMVGTGAFQPNGDGPTPTDPPPAETPLPEGMVRVPNTIGMDDEEAIATALEAGLSWQIRCNTVPGAPPEIHDQEPPPDAVVARGSRLTMFSQQMLYCRRN